MSSTEFGDLETLCKGIMKDKQPFERLEISKETLLEMFKVKPFLDTLTKREHEDVSSCSNRNVSS